jgi:D-alanyl-lipoteichoic acid acyltransferase DltB (MBOAT superfamily)
LSYRIPALDILLPIGISFHTFQTLAYTIDLYRERIPVERGFGRFALFVSFFPLLVAGPIERPNHLLPQLSRDTHLDPERLASGLKLILWGLFKKVVIADNLADAVSWAYGSPGLCGGGTLGWATYFFAFQIYCDFSGYSDIAIGSARVLGYDLMQNFRLPYLARGIPDFWSRWHISLSTWFRDYLYIPLGGNRVALPRWSFNIALTFLVSGLWHGANWTFVIWGALHALYFLGGRILGPLAGRMKTTFSLPGMVRSGFQILITFHLVTLAWVFFRARNVSEGLQIVRTIFTDGRGWAELPHQRAVGLALIAVLVFVSLMQHAGWASLYFSRSRIPAPLRWCGYVAMVLAIAVLGKSGNDFIYFQF